MYATGNKKMLNMLILEVLKKYSDEDHSLTQQDIIKLLDKNYGMECDRRHAEPILTWSTVNISDRF